MEGGREQNYWPGFVDALSNVVLTLVFVLVVFVFALMMASNKVQKKMQEVATAEKAQKAGQVELDKALAELVQLRAQEAQEGKNNKSAGTEATEQQQSCLRFAKSDANQKTEVAANGDYIMITFGANAISITEETAKAIHDYIEASKAKLGGLGKFTIESSEDPTSSSPLLSRETQLGRILNARNSLLNNKIEPQNIVVHNTTPTQEKGDYNWVKIYAKK